MRISKTLDNDQTLHRECYYSKELRGLESLVCMKLIVQMKRQTIHPALLQLEFSPSPLLLHFHTISPALKICGQGPPGEIVQLYRCEVQSSDAQLSGMPPGWIWRNKDPWSFLVSQSRWMHELQN